MNVTSDNIIVNSCEYTPIYLIPSTGVTQAGSYIITQNPQTEQKPVADNLKSFYENSGKLENGLFGSPKQSILKKQTVNTVGNNLKLASFLLPRNEAANTVTICAAPTISPVTNVVLKPSQSALAVGTKQQMAISTPVTTHTSMVPMVEVERKIVKVGSILKNTKRFQDRGPPKIMPKEEIPPNPPKLTSVQLIKLGKTYHSLNQLNDDQMKLVNNALKIFSEPDKKPKEHISDPAPHTKFIYKVVSPNDLKVVKNKVVVKPKRNFVKRPITKKPEIVEEDIVPPEEVVDIPPTVTRSGRTVKLPKQIRREESPQKPKKKSGSVVTCYQCSAEFCSLYRLQRHYENNPTHVPAKIHSNLFHCLLAIIKGGSEEDQANIFVQQLEQLIKKLKALLPCLLKNIDGFGGKLCTISDEIGRLFGMDPGKYHLNMKALTCVKEKNGHCIHSPKTSQANSDVQVPPHIGLLHRDEETMNEIETEDCARIHSVDNWPTVSRRIQKLKQQKLKRKRMASENSEQIIELGSEAVPFKDESAINIAQSKIVLDNKDNSEVQTSENATSAEDQNKKPKNSHVQFHSTHFDIRSSPIKLPSALVRKFQIKPEKMSDFEMQVMKPLGLDVSSETSNADSDSDNLSQIFRSDEFKDINSQLNGNHKEWDLNINHSDAQMPESFSSNIIFESPAKEASNLIQPSLLHVKERIGLFDQSKSIESLIHLEDLPIDKQVNADFIEIKDSGNLFDTCMKPKINIIESSLENTDKPDNLMEFDKSNDGIFVSPFTHVESQPNNLFESNLIHDKSNMMEPSMIHTHDKNSIFEAALSHLKQRSKNLFEATTTFTSKDEILQSQMTVKNEMFVSNRHTLMNNDHDDLNSSDNRILNQGQHDLNFLETLGNELAYPETEIRNNSVDFQLDLFSFSNS